MSLLTLLAFCVQAPHVSVTAVDLDAFRHTQVVLPITNRVLYGVHHYWYTEPDGGTTLKVKEVPPSEYVLARGGVVSMSNLTTRASLALQVDATGRALDLGAARALVTGVEYGQNGTRTGVLSVVQYRYVAGVYTVEMLDSESYSFEPDWVAIVPPPSRTSVSGGCPSGS